MKKIEAVILDWAGTTVDYGCFAPVQAFAEAFKAFGITPTDDEVREPMGMLKRDHVAAMLSMPRIAQAWQEKYNRTATQNDVDDIYKKSEQAILDVVAQYADPKPFVVETIENLRNRGIKIGSTTGYTNEMIEIVAKNASEKGYAPDARFTPDAVANVGRPYPYMVFENMRKLHVLDVSCVIKVGDTISDIQEGKHAGVYCVGVIEGSSLMGLRQEAYEAMTKEAQEEACERVAEIYRRVGADFIIKNMAQLPAVIDEIEGK